MQALGEILGKVMNHHVARYGSVGETAPEKDSKRLNVSDALATASRTRHVS